MNIEESVTYIKEKIKNKLPEYTETFVDGKPYRMNVLQLETRWTEKTAEAIETLLTAYEKEKEKNKKIEKELEKHIKFCEQEAEGSLNNEICHISLNFNKKLLNILNGEE